MSAAKPNSHHILIAEYTLGLLESHELARAHQLLGERDDAVAMALDWEQNLLELTDLLPPVDPSPLLLQRIQASLGHNAPPAPSSLYRQPDSPQPFLANGMVGATTPAAPGPNGATRPMNGMADSSNGAAVAQAHNGIASAQIPNNTSAAMPGIAATATQEAPSTAAASLPSANAPATSAASISDGALRAAGMAAAGSESSAERNGTPAPGHSGQAGPTARPPAGGSPGHNPHRRAPREPYFNDSAFVGASGATQAPQGRASSGQAAHMGASSLPSTPSDASRISQAPHSSPATEGAPRPAASAPAFSPAQAAARVPPLNPASASDAIPITAPSTLPPPEKRRLMHSVWLWRGATIVFAALALAISLVPKEPLPPPINVVQVAPTRAAILQAPGQSSTPGWIVTFDPQGNVLMSPQVHSDVAPKSAVQLWTYNETVSAPRSLGLIDPNRPITVPAALMGELGKEQYFEMTLEPQGGSPTASPSGPVLFIGRVVTFGAPGTEPVVGGGRPPAASGSAPGSAAN